MCRLQTDLIVWDFIGEILYVLLSMGPACPGPASSCTMLPYLAWSPGSDEEGCRYTRRGEEGVGTSAEPCVLALGTLPLPLLERY